MKDSGEIRLRFGKYKGMMLKQIPLNYLTWTVRNNILRGKAMLWAKYKINWPMDHYKVTVENAASGDGDYFTKAYDDQHAIRIVQKNYPIRNTQSFHGTSYTAIKI